MPSGSLVHNKISPVPIFCHRLQYIVLVDRQQVFIRSVSSLGPAAPGVRLRNCLPLRVGNTKTLMLYPVLC